MLPILGVANIYVIGVPIGAHHDSMSTHIQFLKIERFHSNKNSNSYKETHNDPEFLIYHVTLAASGKRLIYMLVVSMIDMNHANLIGQPKKTIDNN